MLYRVLMFGDRNWSKAGPVNRELKRLIRKHGTRDLLIISGGAPGADQMAAVFANNLDVHCAVVRALWDTRHRGAGPQRNRITSLLEPAEGICFHDNWPESTGSKGMGVLLDKLDIPWRRVPR